MFPFILVINKIISLVDVYIPIKEEFDEKKFANIPIKILMPAERKIRVDVDPSKIDFVLKGSRRQLEKLDPENIVAFLDVSELDLGKHDSPVTLVLPEDVSLKDGASVMVTATIKKN